MSFSERRVASSSIRLVAIALTGLCLAGCTGKPNPPLFEIQLESTPPGAEARTSFGPSCKTPCSVNTPLPDGNFAVTYALEGFLPVTVPVVVTGSPAGFMTPGTSRIEPNPVVATLQPIEPPKPVKPVRPKRPKNTATAPAAPR
jgi:hypothetical protein